MRKMTQKTISVLLSLLMLLSVCSALAFSVSAASYSISVSDGNATNLTLEVNDDTLISAVKTMIKDQTRIPTAKQTLLFNGTELKHDKKIKDYSIQNGSAIKLIPYALGSSVSFGSYPQSEVTDNTLIDKLYKVQKCWQSLGYYSGTGTRDDGKMEASNYAQYADFIYEGKAYRAIEYTKYRPKHTGGTHPTSGNTGKYAVNTIYYFKFEPIEWNVLGYVEGKGMMLMSAKVLDSQPYQSLVKKITKNGGVYYYATKANEAKEANDYAGSSLRSFLTGRFFNAAFSPAQQAKLKSVTFDCSPNGSASGTKTVTDKVTVLSYEECRNAGLGFSESDSHNAARAGSEVSAYAQSQGIMLSNGKAYWWLRTPGSASGYTGCVAPDGSVEFTYLINSIDRGVRPVICMDPVQEDASTSLLGCLHSNRELYSYVPASCREPGHEEYWLCKDCSAILATRNGQIVTVSAPEVFPATGHVDKTKREGGTGPDGWCDVCGEEVLIHTDNSGSLQLSAPIMNILDIIRNIVFKIQELFNKLSLQDDSKSAEQSGGTTTPATEEQTQPELEGAGKALYEFGNVLGGLIEAFRGVSEKKSAEKEADRNSFFEGLLGSFNGDETGNNG